VSLKAGEKGYPITIEGKKALRTVRQILKREMKVAGRGPRQLMMQLKGETLDQGELLETMGGRKKTSFRLGKRDLRSIGFNKAAE